MYKVCLNNGNAKRADMAELRKIKINLRPQVQILEQGKYAVKTNLPWFCAEPNQELKHPGFQEQHNKQLEMRWWDWWTKERKTKSCYQARDRNHSRNARYDARYTGREIDGWRARTAGQSPNCAIYSNDRYQHIQSAKWKLTNAW